ncbi:aspartate aminotransferase, cytoplasmic-like isoform X2 [Lineus longissimus]|uniref:aspartate aminotransferase, cytoplasmic-like isoform X2 n=1 Tax=Lineus longissimus TaxID=88925 RepID=UPI00315C8DCF
MPTPRSRDDTPLPNSPPNSVNDKELKPGTMNPTPTSKKSSRPHSVLSRARTVSAHSQPPSQTGAADGTQGEMDVTPEPQTSPEPCSRFARLQVAPLTEFELLELAYEQDTSPNKTFLASGNFYKDDGTPWSLPVIRTVEAQMAEDLTLNKEYTKPNNGLKAFTDAATRMLFGDDSPAILENRIGTFHTPGGTSALYVGLLVLRNVYGFTDLHIPYPTRGKYEAIVEGMGFDIKYYKYLDEDSQLFDTEAFLDALETAEQQSIFIIVADSPSGPTSDGWDAITKVMWTRHLLPFFHISTQGLATGNVWLDTYPVRHFGKEAMGLDMMVAQSFSKTFGLSGERVGCLHLVGQSRESGVSISAITDSLITDMWMYAPGHGSRVIATIINNAALRAEWKDHVKTMSDRIRLMRHLLYQKMLANGTLWKHLTSQSGLFSTTDFTESQITSLRENHHIYMETHGFFNMSCLRTSTVDYVARCFHEAVQAREDMEEEMARQMEDDRRGGASGASSQS